MALERLPLTAGLVRLLRAALAALLLAGGCMYLPPSVRLTWLLVSGFLDVCAGFYAFLRSRTARFEFGTGLVELRTGVFWKQTKRLRRRDIQAIQLCRTPLLELFGLTAVILRLPGRAYWLDGVPERVAEALI